MVKTSLGSKNRLSANLSPELAKAYGIKSIPIRKGDTVVAMRGNFRDVEGKITKIDAKNTSINIEGVVREKNDGTTIFLPIHPSKVRVIRLNLDDKRRKDILERKASKHTTDKPVERRNTKTRRIQLRDSVEN